MTDAQTYSWILLSIGSPESRNRREISELADAINHAIPTHQEMESSLNWLKTRGLIFETNDRFALTQTGAELLTYFGGSTITRQWHAVSAVIQEMLDQSL